MIVNHNISALNTVNKLTQNNKKTTNAMEKLSSGLRINKASDDAAGLAISEKMKGQIRGLQQAQRNIQDGISLIQTAESGLGSIQDPNLQRLRELSIQAATDTLTDADRQLIQKEVEQIKSGINDIANNIHFNGINLLNETASTTIETETITTTKTVNETVNILSPGIILQTKFLQNPGGGEVIGIGPSTPFDGDGRIVFTFINPPPNPDYIFVPSGADITETLNNIKDIFESIKSGTSGTVAQQNHIIDNNMKFEIYGDNFVLIADKNLRTYYGGGGSFDGGKSYMVGTTARIDYEKKVEETITITHTKVTHKNLTLQIGANSGESFFAELTDARTEALSIDDIDLSNRQGAESAISKIDKALNKVSSERSKFGAYQNALEHINNNASNYEINLTASESRIRDVDIAKQIMDLTKNQILSQASQAMLTQAIQQPQSVLQLLK